MYSFLRPLLFLLDPETAHRFALSSLEMLPSLFFKQPIGKPVEAMGLIFPHFLGLAAGLDKNAEYLEGLSKLGFAFIEVGTVTPKPQLGNPKPRLFRLKEANALINRMGFNNKGVDVLVQNINNSNYKGILGINIGKNKDTPIEHAIDDYIYCLKKVYSYASYITINISSPNTPDLRQLQRKEFINDLLGKLREEQLRLSEQSGKHVPLVVKISPDESDETLKHMVHAMLEAGIEGVITTNTTNSRQGVSHLIYAQESGGLSGSPLFDSSTRCLKCIKAYAGDAMTIIGVGGIDSPETAKQKMQTGASLLQIYTGLIYRGPQIVSDIVSFLNR